CLDLDDTLVDARGSWHAGFAEATLQLRAQAPLFADLGSSGEIYEGQLRPLIIAAQRAAGSREWSNDFARQGFRELLGRHADLDAAAADTVFDAYLDAWPRHLRLFDDVLPALDRLRATHRLALISNGLGVDQRLKIERLGLGDYFEVLVISEEVGVTKPDAAIFAHTLETLGVSPAAALHAGDNPHHDVAGARGHGMHGVWVNRRGGRFDSPDEADAEVSDLGELVALLER
ncbi:MAG: HAD family hydrolase, partial [Chloroflexi bacterium]|nr:HAD family hydrolase [Chloroflexota bacterium]MQC82458.1 HAD family hydrolase [Chloroflexota bacterium]